jgi:hypothetical protein
VTYFKGFVLLPFAVFSILGASKVDPSNWLLGPNVAKGNDDANDTGDTQSPADDGQGGVDGSWGDVNWRVLLNCLFWNVNCFDRCESL